MIDNKNSKITISFASGIAQLFEKSWGIFNHLENITEYYFLVQCTFIITLRSLWRQIGILWWHRWKNCLLDQKTKCTDYKPKLPVNLNKRKNTIVWFICDTKIGMWTLTSVQYTKISIALLIVYQCRFWYTKKMFTYFSVTNKLSSERYTSSIV